MKERVYNTGFGKLMEANKRKAYLEFREVLSEQEQAKAELAKKTNLVRRLRDAFVEVNTARETLEAHHIQNCSECPEDKCTELTRRLEEDGVKLYEATVKEYEEAKKLATRAGLA